MPVTATRSAALVTMLQAEYPNYHPLLSIARLAHNEGADLRLQFECHKTIAKYLEPELKSVEVKSSVTQEKTVRVSLFDVEDVQVKGTSGEMAGGFGSQGLPALSNW